MVIITMENNNIDEKIVKWWNSELLLGWPVLDLKEW
jgi:hypothetical protein